MNQPWWVIELDKDSALANVIGSVWVWGMILGVIFTVFLFAKRHAADITGDRQNWIFNVIDENDFGFCLMACVVITVLWPLAFLPLLWYVVVGALAFPKWNKNRLEQKRRDAEAAQKQAEKEQKEAFAKVVKDTRDKLKSMENDPDQFVQASELRMFLVSMGVDP